MRHDLAKVSTQLKIMEYLKKVQGYFQVAVSFSLFFIFCNHYQIVGRGANRYQQKMFPVMKCGK